MIDVGLSPGVLDLWQQEMLLDYTLEVEGREFKVHKVILASVSDYFKAMLGGSIRESTTDRVVLKGLSADGVSKTIDVIYTGDEEIVAVHAAEILKCAVYFQIPKLVEACTDRLLHDINPENCCQLLSMFVMFSLQKEIKKVMKFMMHNWEAISNHLTPNKVPFECVQVLVELWETSEWQLFQFIKTWIESDYKNRKVHANNLMSQVRFCLVGSEDIKSIKDMELFIGSDSSWCKLVNEADDYHKLPTHQKVLVNKKQVELRGDPKPVIISMDNTIPTITLDKDEDSWQEYESLTVPESLYTKPVVIEVNHFLIIYTVPESEEEDEKWWIFDPRTLTWFKMASPDLNKGSFGLVYHDEHLYMLGGSFVLKLQENLFTGGVSDDVVEYDFKTDTWCAVNKMPLPVHSHGTCILGDVIYISGGTRKIGNSDRTVTSDLDCLDMATWTWHKKAPMSQARQDHQMGVVKLHHTDVILVIDEQLNIEYYTPVSDQWSMLNCAVSSTVIEPMTKYERKRSIIFQGNSVFFLDVSGQYEHQGKAYRRACVRWDFSEDNIHEVILPYYGNDDHRLNAFGVLSVTQ